MENGEINMNMRNTSKENAVRFLFGLNVSAREKRKHWIYWDLKRRMAHKKRKCVTERNKNGNHSFSKQEFKYWITNVLLQMYCLMKTLFHIEQNTLQLSL